LSSGFFFFISVEEIDAVSLSAHANILYRIVSYRALVPYRQSVLLLKPRTTAKTRKCTVSTFYVISRIRLTSRYLFASVADMNSSDLAET